MAVGLPMMMRGRELIEWQDRSWRLLANAGQVEVDNWSLLGAAVGVGAVVWKREVLRGEAKRLGWRTVAGGAGVGSIVGVVGYMGWRYAVMGGKR